MKYTIYALALALALAASGCANEVYERNLRYMTPDTLQAEKAAVSKSMEEARQAFAKAEASGDPVQTRQAKAKYDDARSRYRSFEAEERRRARTW
jgi:hypothetical protein